MLGQPVSMLIPQVIGVKLTGALPEGTTATDLVLTVTEMLRKKGVVGKFVEFFGDGLAELPLADRATIANMAPEYGATCGIFPVDDETLRYLRFIGARRGAGQARRGVLQGAGPLSRAGRARGRVHGHAAARSRLDRAEPRGADAPAGPRQAHRREDGLPLVAREARCAKSPKPQRARLEGRRRPSTAKSVELTHGSVVIAAITSCTNTSNPSVLVAAGLLAKKASEKGLTTQAVGEDEPRARLEGRDRVPREGGAHAVPREARLPTVGYGCTTCIGNSGPLPEAVSKAIEQGALVVAAVPQRQPQLRGPRPRRGARELPRLAAARRRLRARRERWTSIPYNEPLGTGKDGKPVFLRTLADARRGAGGDRRVASTAEMFERVYGRHLRRRRGVEEASRARRATSTRGTRSRPT